MKQVLGSDFARAENDGNDAPPFGDGTDGVAAEDELEPGRARDPDRPAWTAFDVSTADTKDFGVGSRPACAGARIPRALARIARREKATEDLAPVFLASIDTWYVVRILCSLKAKGIAMAKADRPQ